MHAPSGAFGAERIQPPWLEQALAPWRACRQRILVVADGALDFNESNGLGLTELLGTLATSDPFGLHPIVTIAHRDDNERKASVAIKTRFAFLRDFRFIDANRPEALMHGDDRHFDQIWLFGSGTVPIADDEVRVIARFMQARGGVFATGDHEHLGSGLSARLPRVRKMRAWFGPPSPGRPRYDNVPMLYDGCDIAPRRVFAHVSSQAPRCWIVHPLMRQGARSGASFGAISVLPRPPRDVECLSGIALGDAYALVNGVDPNEFPMLPFSRVRLSPEIVATALSSARHVDQGPTRPRCIGLISAYDGHRVGVGRIVCDSTWHHFINVNLNGMGADPPHRGLYDRLGYPTEALRDVTRYYENIAGWLGQVRHCRWFVDILVQRFKTPLLEELVDAHATPQWAQCVDLGHKVGAALDAVRGRGTGFDLVRDALVDLPAASALAGIHEVDALARYEPALLPSEEFASGLLGAMAHEVIARLPDNAWELAPRFTAMARPLELADHVISLGLERGLKLAAAYYEQAARHTLDLVHALQPVRVEPAS
ncbi:MAG TPA: hypothetical protein VFS42_08120 [Burkholderiaceae bacterium]|nr:hypothetical protein [Burkholderiaceae bacterium]